MTRWLAGVGASSLLVLTSATPAGAVPGPRNDQWWFTAWEVQQKVWPITQGSGVTIGVIDSGINGNLPDLKGAVVPGTDLTQGSGNGYVGGSTDLQESHGTSMAALMVGQGGGTGYVGVAPQAKAMAIKANLTNWDKSIRFAVDRGAKVINLSQGLTPPGGQCRPETQQAVSYALERDVVVVASAGNSGDRGNPSMEPANCVGVLAVGAVDNEKRAWFATERQPYVDIAAPGASMAALLANGQISERVAGTSGSAALTSSVVALVRAKYPQMSGREVVQRLLNTTKDAGPPGKDNMTGVGVIIPVAALTAQVPKSASNSVYAEYDQWKQANPNAVQGGGEQAGGQNAEKKDVPPSEQTKASDNANRNTMILLGVVGAVVIVGALVAFLLIRKSKKKAAPAGPGPGPGFGPQGGQPGPPPGWGGQQPGPPMPPQQQYGPPPQGGAPQPPMQPQGGQPQAPPPQGPGGPPGGQYPPR
ncbi:S8/S53 family peptidase [Actinomadura sp. WMMB 499]|uniref:S8 family peptidase n=1 Tax=Actinomadura sp. WMMB 499 TaxID=1219491 RepID=UPI001247D453|nr:S8/S53 family peptidase [Actinomadura sp. WMMB 499]QFG22080.1 S8 family serine peptidase [Actinomadura sp. WMMB 499]